MIRLMIVDDDIIIRRGLSQAIPWEEYGFCIAGVAGDGQVALDMVEQVVPDIIIADIRMPHIDGLELAKLLQLKCPEIKVILLTAYKDFEYAKTAIKLNVYDYLLKPVDNQALLEVVARAALAKAEQQKVNQKLEESKPLLLQQFFLGLIEERYSPDELRTKMELLEIAELSSPLVIAIIKLDGFYQNILFKKDNLKGSVLELIKELTEKRKVLIIDTGQDEIVLIGSAEDANDTRLILDMGRLIELIRQTTAEKLHAKVKLGIGKTYDNLLQTGRSYAEACTALEINHVLGSMQNTLVGQAIDYITGHYNQSDLSLQEIAGVIHLSPTYLSSIFKKEQGINFSDFVLDLRMDKAKELLSSGVLRVYEVAELVGYNNVHYFSACFKKYTGISPTDYKKV